MRHSFVLVFAALAALAGCNSQNAPAPSAQQPAAAPIASAVSGRVMLREPRELSPQARLELRVVDVANPGLVLAQTVIKPANQPPVQFNLPIDTGKVDPRRTYAVEAMLVDGERRYLPVLQYPVLTNKAPAQVEIVVAPEATPAEKMYEDFKKTFGQIGSLKQVSGSGETDKSTTAWDAFLSNGKPKVVREITSLYDDKANETGRITLKMAYQNDKPWVVVREESPPGSNRATSSTRVGWDDNGTLVLKERGANGQGSEVSADEAKALYAHAQQAYSTALAKAPKK